MKAKNIQFQILAILLFVLCISSVYSLNVEIVIEEDSSLNKLLNGKYSLVADGVLSIRNPSNVSKIYEFVFPINLDSLIGINKINLPNTSYYDNSTNSTVTLSSGSEKFYFNFDEIKGYMIEPNETIKVGYHIFGLLDYNIYENINNSNNSVLNYYIESYDMVSNVVLNLQKPEREGDEYSLNGTKIIDKPSNSTRLVSSQIRNPTDYNLYIEELKIYKTSVSDPFFNNGVVLKKFNNFSVEPFSSQTFDVFDKASDETAVYWLSSNTYIKPDILSKINRRYTVEKKPGSGGNSNDGGSSGSGWANEPNFNDAIIINKDVDKTLIMNGEEFKVTLTIANVKNFNLENLTLFDEIPDNYEIKEVSESVKISGKELKFDIDKINLYSTLKIEYVLISKKEYKGITYLKPAKIIHMDNNYFSDGILLINDLLPEQKVFVQKEVKYIDEDYAKVHIIVKNLGNYHLEDILISDEISEDSILKDISKVFYERGLWKINSLKPGEEWEVSYLVSRDSKLDTLPNVFGVEKSDVYGTMISSEEVVTVFKQEPKTIEKIGMTLAVGFLIVYLLF